ARLERRLPALAGDRVPQGRAGEDLLADRRAERHAEAASQAELGGRWKPPPHPLNDQQLLRYSRHILLPEIGIEGQEKLRASHALIVGAGGLGCPAALYLAAAGIGRLTLVDSDKVDLTNLQRQILYRADSVGAVKVDAARGALNGVNPDVTIVPLHQRLADFGDLAR